VTPVGACGDRAVKLGGESGELAEQPGLGGAPVEVGLVALVCMGGHLGSDLLAHPVGGGVEFLEQGVGTGLVQAGQPLELVGDLAPPVGVRARVERAIGVDAGGAVADEDRQSGRGHKMGVPCPAGVLVEPRAGGVQHVCDIAE
jgi:hypothetical protein